LAAGGLRFTQFYNTGRCCPTRASLLTGLYSHQAGMGHMTDNLGRPGYVGHLNNQCVTLGGVLSDAGYHAAVVGKWHVGHKDRSMWPLARGFDRFYGIPEGGGFYFQVKTDRSVVLNDTVIAGGDTKLPEGWYSTDAWIENGLKFVDEATDVGKPFFLYIAHNAPHFPLQARSEDIALFRGKYRAGWDQLSSDRHQRQLRSGLVRDSWQKTDRPDAIAAWDSLNAEEQDRFDHMMAAYAACVYSMDRSIGNLVSGLKSRQLFDNTIILFMSDNGGCAESGPNGRSTGDPTTPDSNWFCGESWAWMQDTPFRKYKHYNHEGGIATPLIVHWPAGIASPGEDRPQISHVIDIMPTVVELGQAQYPTNVNGQSIVAMQGRSLVSAIRGEPDSERPIFWEHEGNAAVRLGKWKLVREGGRGKWELFDMETDRTEQHNLASQHPDRVQTLRKMWKEWAAMAQVVDGGLPGRNR
ncbi:MAG: arylsulfatase, partial [Planctomycetaceae bacterium]|nr:arylsulfatase [Planctomycetaceae bacterium]